MINNNLVACIHKIYNLKSPIDIQRIINNNDYYSLIEHADSFNFQTQKDIVKIKVPNTNENIIVHYNSSMSGTHSVVHKGFLNESNIVVKEKKSKYNIKEFATEIFLQVCLFCLQNHINKCSNFKITTIPRVYKVCKFNDLPVIMIQDVDISLQTFITKHPLKEVIPVLLIIIFDLYVLQITCEFMHRDLHHNNILVELLTEEKTFKYGNFSFTSRYQPYFIDFGYACFNMNTACLQLNQNKIIVTNYYKNPSQCNFNRTHDLKTLLASIFDDLSCCVQKNKILYNFLNKKFSKYLIYKKYEPLYLYFYEQINIVDNNFLPEVIFKEFKSFF